MEPFTILEKDEQKSFRLFDNVLESESAKTADHDLQYVAALRKEYPDKIITAIPQLSADIIAYAHAGHAMIELDISTDSFATWRGYVVPAQRSQKAVLGEAIQFAKFHVQWHDTTFLIYLVRIDLSAVQYVVVDKAKGEVTLGPSSITDSLIMAAGAWQNGDTEIVWVFDGYWRQDKTLWQQVKKASWDKVILDEKQKKELTSVANTFFLSKHIYEELGVPWKRGLLFHGPPGNGKTISIKALMHALLFERGEDPIPTLYVKSAAYTVSIGAVFQKARQLAPCMMVLEDVETIVTPSTRSYFFNEMDGLANNDGLFVVASTNYLDRLDPGLTKRPSRFDRKYLFPLPNEHERILYCQFWRQKVQKNPAIDFPEKLCPAMARITPAFSFAFLQECFVATMLSLIGGEQSMDRTMMDRPTMKRPTMDEPMTKDETTTVEEDLDRYELWRAFKQQADILKKEIEYDTCDQRGGEGDQDAGEAHDFQRAMLVTKHAMYGRDFNTTGQQTNPTAGSSRVQTDLTAALSSVQVDLTSASSILPLAARDRKSRQLNSAIWQWSGPSD